MKRNRSVSFNVIWQACIGCSACVAVCPQPEPFVSSHDTVALDTPCDIACMRCVEVCPTSAITFKRLAEVTASEQRSVEELVTAH
jgi:formate hydrogenlyase subunit 6/NADH:ubiquinone oxidoreductase subunit I